MTNNDEDQQPDDTPAERVSVREVIDVSLLQQMTEAVATADIEALETLLDNLVAQRPGDKVTVGCLRAYVQCVGSGPGGGTVIDDLDCGIDLVGCIRHKIFASLPPGGEAQASAQFDAFLSSFIVNSLSREKLKRTAASNDSPGSTPPV